MPAATVEHHLRPGTLQLQALPPLALYVHLPWCLAKCPYCDFNSHEIAPAALPEQRYLAALRADLELALPLVWGRPVVSVFIGGGTPSLFSPHGIAGLISSVRSLLPLEPGCEVTLEANPGTFERERFRAFAQAGINRLSIGVQSFDDTLLRRIGRVHDAAQARAAVQEASETFERFNIDLMYALPGQTLQQLHADLDRALAFRPPHLSVYHLTIEPNTRFALHPPERPDLSWLEPPTGAHAVAARVLAAVNRVLCALMFRLRVTGREHIPEGPVIVAVNHLSDLDPVIVAAALPKPALRRIRWSGERSRLFVSRIGRFLARAARIFPVDERQPATTLAYAKEALARGDCLVWFPRGWRSPDGTVQRFLPGVGELVRTTGATLVPARIAGTFEAMPRTARFPRPHPVRLAFGAPIPAATLTEGAASAQEVADRVREAVIRLPA